MALISLLHPSRGRAEKSFRNYEQWIQKSGAQSEIEIIVSVDESDDYLKYYRQYTPQRKIYKGIQVMTNNNTCVVEATNKAAAAAKGDILVYLSDDFKAPENWGQLVINEFKDATGPRLIKVDDCLQNFDVPVLTIPIMNRALYERLGYFWHPEYKSMHVDCDLYETVKRLGALKLCPHLKFPHEHVSIGKAPMDETYRRSSAHWDQGLEVFRRRQKLNFPA